jgi:acyl-CoA reductase-like NAD-dependent aldehyde dehydrogenase
VSAARGVDVWRAVIPDTSMHACLAQKALFGPLVVAMPVDGEDELVRTAYDAIVGLGAAVRSSDPARALLAHGVKRTLADRRVSLV